MLVRECDDANVMWCRPSPVHAVRAIDHAPMRFEVDTDRGSFQAAHLVIATGGLAIPQIGATPFGYRIAEQFGLNIIAPKPALVPLTLDVPTLEKYGALSGVSFEAIVSLPGHTFRESVLLTHRGLSGPAI